MQQVFCPHCGSPVLVDETAASAQLRQEQELEILRLQAELEQICARFELELQQKDRELALYREMLGRDASEPQEELSAAGSVDSVILELNQAIAGLTSAREALRKLSAE